MRKETADITRACLMCSAQLMPLPTTDRESSIITLAQWLAAGGAPAQKLPQRLLRPVFTHMNGEHGGRALLPQPLDNVLRMPVSEKSAAYSRQAVQARLDEALAACKTVPAGEEGLAPLLGLLEQQFTNLPAPIEGSDDISLYDFCKLTAAIGSCISEGMDGDITKERLQNESCFLLCSADFSGIQSFIYTVQVGGALRALRSRSFVLELLMEHYIDELLALCGVSRANLLYSGGGHCYLLLPNTDKARQAITGWNKRFNDWLAEQFGVQLFLAQGYTECSGNELMNKPAQNQPQKAMFRRVSAQVSRHKLNRFSAQQLRRLNSGSADGSGRECMVCGRPAAKNSEDRCQWCGLFETISGELLRQPFFWIDVESYGDADFTLPTADGKAGVYLLSRTQVDARFAAGTKPRRLYSKNCYCPSLPRCTILHMGDYAYSSSMEELAEGSDGVRRLAVCRMDVDNLGQAFVAGFERQGRDGGKYVSLVRTAAFSRRMSLFFKGYINSILSGEYNKKSPLKVTVVYSGGDDVFLVGAWNDAIEAAGRIQAALAEYSCGALTISGGVGVFKNKFPIRAAAAATAELEEEAKSLPDKNGIALFASGEGHCYPWQVFREKVWDEKLEMLDSFFSDDDSGRGNAMLYNILALLRNAQEDGDRMPLARYAYLLARLTPPASASAEKKAKYKAFSAAMYSWGVDKAARGQLITAIQLYVYLNRNTSEEGC